jgi:NADH-quinone oxidoreductase subunit C
MSPGEMACKLANTFGEDCLSHHIWRDELTLTVQSHSIAKILTYLRDHGDYLFKQLIDLCGVDYPDRVQRFEVVYHLLSLKYNRRLRLKVYTDEKTPIPSATSIYSSANWWEREAWDLFGIQFEGHPDLRRLLTDYGFEGHPLRKDFPLTGYVEVHYDDKQKRVVYDQVQLPQAYRNFDFLSPWEGMTPLLPGDEKATDGKAIDKKEDVA